MSKRDYYEVLGTEKGASADDIKRAYRRMAMKYHPDRNKGSDAAAARFKEISEAYAVLNDPEKRKKYDQLREAGARGGAWNFEDLFGGAGRGRWPSGTSQLLRASARFAKCQ